MLLLAGGNKSEAARRLGISRPDYSGCSTGCSIRMNRRIQEVLCGCHDASMLSGALASCLAGLCDEEDPDARREDEPGRW